MKPTVSKSCVHRAPFLCGRVQLLTLLHTVQSSRCTKASDDPKDYRQLEGSACGLARLWSSYQTGWCERPCMIRHAAVALAWTVEAAAGE